MARYRKKPVVIEAVQWKGNNFVDIDNFITDYHETYPKKGLIKIQTLEGVMEANVGDYIIKGVNGEFYPCKPDIFIKTYKSAFIPEDSNGICENTEGCCNPVNDKKSKIAGITVDVSVKNSFGYALELLKHGKAVTRKGWNGKGMYVQKVENMDFESLGLLPFLVIKNTKGTFNTWVPSISDLFSEDWEEVEL